MSNSVDIIIIGSGIAGLYAAYQIKRIAPANTTFLILEKNPKKWMGGRIGNETFYGADVVIGAGVGRKNKDHALIKLLRDLKVEYSEFTTTRNSGVSFNPVDIMKTIQILKGEYKKNPTAHKHKTFKQFFTDILGSSKYKDFVITTGYTDFENADVYETLYHYGMDDNVGGWIGLGIPWNELVERLYEEIGSKHFRFSSEVREIQLIGDVKREAHMHISANQRVAGLRNPQFEITTADNKKYYANKVVVATTITAVKKIVPTASAPTSIYQQIHGQPFLIVYAKFDKASTETMKKYVTAFTVVTGPLQKLIPMEPDKGVYMIAYTDNQHAKSLKAKGALQDTPDIREMYSKWIKNALGIPIDTHLHITAIRDYYWNDGTHYYEPLGQYAVSRPEFIRKAQHPIIGMVVVGEMVSRHQGWVEGAIESVDAVVTRDWVTIPR